MDDGEGEEDDDGLDERDGEEEGVGLDEGDGEEEGVGLDGAKGLQVEDEEDDDDVWEDDEENNVASKPVNVKVRGTKEIIKKDDDDVSDDDDGDEQDVDGDEEDEEDEEEEKASLLLKKKVSYLNYYAPKADISFKLDASTNKYRVIVCLFTIDKELILPFVSYFFTRKDDEENGGSTMTFPSSTIDAVVVGEEDPFARILTESHTIIGAHFKGQDGQPVKKHTLRNAYRSFKTNPISGGSPGEGGGGGGGGEVEIFIFFNAHELQHSNPERLTSFQDAWLIMDEIKFLRHKWKIPVDLTIVNLFHYNPELSVLRTVDDKYLVYPEPRLMFACVCGGEDGKYTSERANVITLMNYDNSTCAANSILAMKSVSNTFRIFTHEPIIHETPSLNEAMQEGPLPLASLEYVKYKRFVVFTTGASAAKTKYLIAKDMSEATEAEKNKLLDDRVFEADAIYFTENTQPLFAVQNVVNRYFKVVF